MQQSNLPVDPLVQEARGLCESGIIPRKAYDAYRSQVYNARQRGIPFLMNIDDWWAWWTLDGRWEKRGLRGNGLVMARRGDVGPYAIWNIYCCNHSQNMADQDHDKLSLSHKIRHMRFVENGGSHHLAVRGDGHPKSRAVVTPSGRFGSGALAAEHYGVTRTGASLRANRRERGWHWEDEPPTATNPVDMNGDYPVGRHSRR